MAVDFDNDWEDSGLKMVADGEFFSHICHVCGGDGMVESTCEQCGGRGCALCQDSGKRTYSCPNCKGRGELFMRKCSF